MMITPSLAQQLADRRLRVAVLGDAMLDGWLSGDCNRLCPEAPVPVVQVTATSYVPGGAANTAVNLAALGARVQLVSVVGDDAAGGVLTDELATRWVDTRHVVIAAGRATTAKRRVVVGDQLLLRVDEGEPARLDGRVADELVRAAGAAIAGSDAVVVCDYGTGVLDGLMLSLLERLRGEIPLLAVDAHHLGRWRALSPDLVTPNAAEAAAVLGVALDPRTRIEALQRHRAALHAATGADAVVVTLDRDGALLFCQYGRLRGEERVGAADQPVHRTWARPAPDNHAAGAGDTFVAALTVAVGSGLPLTTAVEVAQAAADVVTGRPGTAACTTAELAERLGRGAGDPVDAARLASLVAEHRAAGRRIVFTNGCFDVLHRGHVAYLNQARLLGDVLIVAVNSDASVRRLKGSSRPVNTAADRAAMLAALSCVDHVTIFEQDTPVALLRELRPEVYAKGGDYTPQMLPEASVVAEYGGTVRIVDYVSDHSTTAMIERIRATTPSS